MVRVRNWSLRCEAAVRSAKTPAEKEGLKRLIHDQLMAELRTDDPLSGAPAINGKKLEDLLNTPGYRSAFAKLFGTDRAVSHMLVVAKQMDRVSARPKEGIPLMVPNKLLVNTARIIAARIMGVVGQESAGGSLQNAMMASEVTKRFVGKLTSKYFDDFVFEMMHNPQTFADMMEIGKDPERMANYLLNVIDMASAPKGKFMSAVDKTLELVTSPRTYAFLLGMSQNALIHEMEEKPGTPGYDRPGLPPSPGQLNGSQ